MKQKRRLAYLLKCTVALFLVSLLSQASHAQTLYDRSLVRFEEKAQKADPRDFTFVVLGDSRNGEEVFKRALRLAESFHPLFILHGGDYSLAGSEGETERFLQVLREELPDTPLFVVLGNHEQRRVFESRIGPFHFSLQNRRLGFDLIAVDDAENLLKGSELDFLRSALAKAGAGVFVAMHVPPKTERWGWHTFREGADELKKILAASRVQGIFFSHVHLFDRARFGGVPAFITGGAGAPLYDNLPGQPLHHILVVRVKNGESSVTMVPVPK